MKAASNLAQIPKICRYDLCFYDILIIKEDIYPLIQKGNAYIYSNSVMTYSCLNYYGFAYDIIST
jgi:hypothetical protein